MSNDIQQALFFTERVGTGPSHFTKDQDIPFGLRNNNHVAALQQEVAVEEPVLLQKLQIDGKHLSSVFGLPGDTHQVRRRSLQKPSGLGYSVKHPIAELQSMVTWIADFSQNQHLMPAFYDIDHIAR